MDANSAGERDVLIDLESGTKEVLVEQDGAKIVVTGGEQAARGQLGVDGQAKREEVTGNGNDGCCAIEIPNSKAENLGALEKGEENVALVGSKGSEKPKKKGSKKPPKPPRAPKSKSLDFADQKLMRELAELAAMKRARIERMKKRIKNTKLASSNNNSNMFALIITILFGLVIIWQGLCSHGSSSIRFHGSPEASVQTRDGIISLQFYKNASQLAPDLSQSASPNNAAPVATLFG